MRFKRCFLVITVLVLVLIRDLESAAVRREVTEFSEFMNRGTDAFPEARIIRVRCQMGYREIGGRCRKIYYR